MRAKIYQIKSGKHNNCPLSEIPTPHGRLIDADKLIWFIDNHIASGKKMGRI